MSGLMKLIPKISDPKNIIQVSSEKKRVLLFSEVSTQCGLRRFIK